MSTSSNMEFDDVDLPINRISYNDPMWESILAGKKFNVIGVIVSVGKIQEISTKRNILLPKRNITLGDASGKTNALFNVEYHNLAINYNASIQINPDIPEAHNLREWYNTVGKNSVGKNKIESCITLFEAESHNPEVGGLPYHFSQLGVITLLNSTEAIYKACPKCKKKLEHQQNPEPKCKNCNKEICNNYIYGLKVDADISDSTGHRNVIAFGESAEIMLGKNIQEIAQLFENNKFMYAQVFEKAVYKTLIFDLSAKKEIYEDQPSLRSMVQCCYPFDYSDANAILLKKIKEITGVEC